MRPSLHRTSARLRRPSTERALDGKAGGTNRTRTLSQARPSGSGRRHRAPLRRPCTALTVRRHRSSAPATAGRADRSAIERMRDPEPLSSSSVVCTSGAACGRTAAAANGRARRQAPHRVARTAPSRCAAVSRAVPTRITRPLALLVPGRPPVTSQCGPWPEGPQSHMAIRLRSICPEWCPGPAGYARLAVPELPIRITVSSGWRYRARWRTDRVAKRWSLAKQPVR
jgi:hypothetical protein